LEEGVTNQKQFIEYTAFNKVSRIMQGIDEQTINRVYDIFYGLDEQRIKTVYDDIAIEGHIKTRYYFGTYEKDIDEFGNIAETDYLCLKHFFLIKRIRQSLRRTRR
jgi:hypothetical protein